MKELDDLSELDKLENAAHLIKGLTHGRLELRPGVLGAYIFPAENANIGIEMDVRTNMALERYDVTFHVQLRRMGVNMDLDGLQELLAEIHEAYALLAALNLREYHPSQENMEAFQDFLVRQQEPEAAGQFVPGLGPG